MRRAEVGAGIVNVAGVQKRARLERDHSIAIENLVGFGVHKDVVAAERGVAFLAVLETGMATEPQASVAVETQSEQTIEGNVAEAASAAKGDLRFIVVAAGFGQPAGSERAFGARIAAEGLGEKGAEFAGRLGAEREAAFGAANKPALNGGTGRDGRTVGEKRNGSRRDTVEVTKFAIGILGGYGPLPEAALEEAELCAADGLLKIEASELGRDGNDRVGKIPIFVAGVDVEAIANGGIPEQWSSEFRTHAALLIVPAVDRGPVQAGLVEIVEFGINRLVGQVAKQRKQRFPTAGREGFAFRSMKGEIERVDRKST